MPHFWQLFESVGSAVNSIVANQVTVHSAIGPRFDRLLIHP
jgi:hypothetical protein